MMLQWNPDAIADRIAIMDYIAQDNQAAAIELDELIESRAEGLLDNPKLYKPGRVKGTREMVVTANYVAVYRTAGQIIEILRVLHTSQQWPARG